MMVHEFKVTALLQALQLVCLAIAAFRLAVVAVPLVTPPMLTTQLTCAKGSCRIDQDLLRLVPEHKRILIKDGDQAREALGRRLELLRPRLLLATSLILVGLPMFFMYLGLARLFHIAAKEGPFNLRALRWVRRTALAALLSAIAAPVASGIRSLAVLPAISPEAGPSFTLNLNHFLGGILLSAIILAASWAVTRGQRLEEESESFL